MRIIQVQSPGLLTTVQDLGREGFGPLGVFSVRRSRPNLSTNRKPIGSQSRKCSGPGNDAARRRIPFSARRHNRVNRLGFGATLDGARLDLWKSTEVSPDQTLRVGSTQSGARCYISVHGGIAVKPFLGSASTHLLSGLGGYEGRALRKGDVLQINDEVTSFRKKTIAPQALEQLAPRKVLRVTPGPQSEWFPESSLRAFCENTYRVAEESNRMGLRLEGQPIARESNSEMITEGVSLGAVQITASGLPIILFVEQQTTGGYPKIANVISADLHSLGQLRPRDDIRFEQVGWEAARSLLLQQEQLLASDGLIVG